MGIKEFLHMNKGDGELSYVQNSFVQNGVWLTNQHIIESTIETLFSEDKGVIKGLNGADFGCGVGQVPLALVSKVIESIQRKCKELNDDDSDDNHQMPKLHIYMNDLPSNDFSLLFKNLLNLEVLKRKDDSEEPLCYLMGVPGSYYVVLFPHNSLHFVHSNYALQWLSKGLIKEEKLDNFDFPCYLASTKQLESILEKEGSITVEHSNTMKLDFAPEIEEKWERSQIITNSIRAFSKH